MFNFQCPVVFSAANIWEGQLNIHSEVLSGVEERSWHRARQVEAQSISAACKQMLKTIISVVSDTDT
jgi:hypothetical protein